jgi:glutathione-regulated potassium-efflux system ancillary protein KefC
MDNSFLFHTFFVLAAACIVVPLAGRFRLGSVLGYLAVGVLVGPFGMGLINNAQEIMHFAEFGIVMMLFLIGLELEPNMLWRLRKLILGLGVLQIIFTTVLFMTVLLLLGFNLNIALAVGMILSLSSTALVVQILEEKKLMQTRAGESAFSVLLLQDIAVIPMLVILPLLTADNAFKLSDFNLSKLDPISLFAGSSHVFLVLGAIAALIISGRYFSHHLFRFVAKTNLREVFTATSLALVLGVALLMQLLGVSAALGAFIAGVVLASSEYKHTVETDIAPFKGLLLGLFFISVGMGINFNLLISKLLNLAIAVLALVLIKLLVLLILGRFFNLKNIQNMIFAIALAQGGEFAFVLFKLTSDLKLTNSEETAFFNLVIVLSMAVTPFFMILNDIFITPKFLTKNADQNFDVIEENDNPVIIAGYGRFGQIIGRFLTAQGVSVTILETDPDQIDLLKRFNRKVYYGDASNLDLLKSAGAAKAKLLVVAVDEPEKVLEIVNLVKKEFPNLKIFARARNRRHAYELYKAGVDYFRRETFDASLVMAEEVMKSLGKRAFNVRFKAQQFMLHDQRSLEDSFEFFETEEDLISFSRKTVQELETILQSDLDDEEYIKANDGW